MAVLRFTCYLCGVLYESEDYHLADQRDFAFCVCPNCGHMNGIPV